MHSKTRFRDWAVAVIGTMFVVMGIVILPANRNVGITTIAFFIEKFSIEIAGLVKNCSVDKIAV